MKTKRFIQKVKGKQLPTKVSTNGDKIYIYPNISTLAALAWVSKSKNEFHIFENCPIDLAELVFAYGMTPVEEREEEMKYRYRFPFGITTMSEEVTHICRNHMNRKSGEMDYIILDSSGDNHAERSEEFHFTDKEVEQHIGADRALFNACEKIEVAE